MVGAFGQAGAGVVAGALRQLGDGDFPEEGEYYSDAWAEAHRRFHRALLEGCGNSVLLDTFDRMWTASELGRRWASQRIHRSAVDEHRRLEEAALARDPALATAALARHPSSTAAALSTG